MGKFDTKINWRLNNNFTKYLFDFFICKDIQKIGNVNIFFRNFSINHSFQWIPYLKDVIKTEYNIELPENQIDNNFKEANQMKRKYKIKNYDGLYLLIENSRLKIMKLAQYSNWVWESNNKYLNENILPKSFFNDKKPKLGFVIDCDVLFTFNLITPNNFSLYLHQAFPLLSENSLNLDIFIDGKKIYYSEYPNTKTGYKKGFVMKDCFICEIDINHFDLNKNEHEIKIEFKHKYLTEIKGWLIDYAK